MDRAVGRSPIRVLFICTHNAARSQMSEALLGRSGGPEFEVASAGTEPSQVHPLAIQTLAEDGIDWSRAESKLVTAFVGQPFDVVVTVCDRAREACPVFPGAKQTLHWDLDDPSEVRGTDAERLAAFRATRDEIVRRLEPFIADARAASR